MSRRGQVVGLIALFFVGGLFILGAWFVSTSNNLAEIEGEVDNSWAQVENVLQRRYDLIPNLVSSVEGSMVQEQEVFGNIADARRTVAQASSVEDVANANAELSSGLETLLNVVHQDYPELTSNENVRDLMTQLEESENRIIMERKRYNDAVTEYNIAIGKTPTNIVAKYTGHDVKGLFTFVGGADVDPTVEFNEGG